MSAGSRSSSGITNAFVFLEEFLEDARLRCEYDFVDLVVGAAVYFEREVGEIARLRKPGNC